MAKMVTNDMKFPRPSIMIAAMCMAAGLSALQSQEEKPKAKAPSSLSDLGGRIIFGKV